MGIADKLLNAQRSVQAVAKDATNQFHKYDYVSSEAMIADCRRALHDAGLSIACVCRKIAADGDRETLTSTFRLFDDKDTVDLSIDFPIVPDKGRPRDKAAAGAMTMSLSYFLRDLLLVPRKDEADINARDDRNYEPSKGARSKLVNTFAVQVGDFSGAKPGTDDYAKNGKAIMGWLGYKRPVSELSEMELENALNTLRDRIAEGATFDDVKRAAVAASK